MSSLFPSGQIVATDAAIDAIQRSTDTLALARLLSRHLSADWGDVPPADQAANDAALRDGGRLRSVYTLDTGQQIVVISAANRRSTCVLLPSDE